ncbi:MAG: TonB-dependent receptor, partial [candidate division NC10 bacterium]|nr:TonB-dependent receptor [candidate division NC10 bacterium]
MVWLFLSPIANAQQEAEESEYVLEPMIVTATKVPELQKQITQKVDVVSDAEIEQLMYPNRNVAESMKYKPGAFVNVLSRNDANWGSYGGLTPKYNVQLLDGLPIDSFVDDMSLDPWAFDRVEVHRGPAAVLYPNYLTQDFAGNEAPLAGISNFVLKDKVDQFRTRAFFGVGSYNTWNGRVYNQGKAAGFHYLLGANYEQSDYTDYGTRDSWLNMIDDPEYQKTRLYLKTSYFFRPEDDHKISLFVHHTSHSGDAGRPHRDFDHRYDTANAVYQNQVTPWLNVQAKGGYRWYERTWDEDNYPANLGLREHDGVEQEIWPADLVFSVKHFGNSLLTLGGDYQHAHYTTFSEVEGKSRKGNDSDASNLGIYLQENFVIGPVVLRAGGRYNNTKYDYDLLSGRKPDVRHRSWDRLLWSAGVRYNAFDWLSVYANAGSSFLAPSAKSVGGTLNKEDYKVPGMHGQLPNPDLDPEEGIGFDVGADSRIGGRLGALSFGFRGFYNKVDDAIVENRVSLDPSQTRSVNAGKAISYGVELEVNHRFNKYLSWFGNVTFTETKIENSVDSDQDGSDVPFVPRYVANLGVAVNLPWGTTVAPYVHAVGRYYDSSSKSGR